MAHTLKIPLKKWSWLKLPFLSQEIKEKKKEGEKRKKPFFSFLFFALYLVEFCKTRHQTFFLTVVESNGIKDVSADGF